MSKKSSSKLFPNNDVENKALTDTTVDADVDLSIIRRKRIRINKDDNKIIELNISDLNIPSRLKKAYHKLTDYIDEVYNKISDIDDQNLSDEDEDRLIEALAEIDKKMCEQVDYIFDYPVSEACADGGSMWDPIEGEFRYEHIISTLLELYENNLSSEFTKMRNKVNDKLKDHRQAVSKYHK